MPERLSQLVYFNALVPQDGQAVVDLLPAGMRERFERSREEGDGWRVPAPPLENDPRVAAFARRRHVASLVDVHGPGASQRRSDKAAENVHLVHRGDAGSGRRAGRHATLC